MARLVAAAVAGIALGTMLGGCSDIYYDRRDTIALGAGDAIAANEFAQMADPPWPAHSGNRNIAANGQKMQSAVERYRTNKVTPPVDPTTTAPYAASQQQTATGQISTQAMTPNGTPSPSITTSGQGSAQ